MKNIRAKYFIAFVLVTVILSSCVPKKKFAELSAQKTQCEFQNEQLNNKNRILEDNISNKEMSINDLEKSISDLKSDTASFGRMIRKKDNDYQLLKQSYKMMTQKTHKRISSKEKEILDLQTNLLKSKAKVKEREKDLLALAKDLDIQKKNLDKLKDEYIDSKTKLEKSQALLNEKEKKLINLQNILNTQDSTVRALNDRVSKAFYGYKDKGLKVELKNGKVYVSLDEKLLFATGSTNVNSEGKEALKKLSKILEKDTNISVLVEGHTDDIPYTSTQGAIKDNWDLSVLRATTVVRIIIKNGDINPQRITPAGRGPYVPIEDKMTKEARAKNRRIEIILTPKLNELFKMIEMN